MTQIFSLLVFVCLSQQISPPPTHQQVSGTTPQNPSTESKKKQQIDPFVTRESDQTQSNRAESQEKKNPDKQPRSHTDEILAYSTGAIAVFTLLTTWAFFRQIRISHNAERAWISVDERTPPEALAYVDFPKGLENFIFTYTFRNRGRTHARVKFARVRFQMLEKLESLPKKPQFDNTPQTSSNGIPPDGVLYPPGEGFVIYTNFEGLNGEDAPTKEQINAVRNHRAFLVTYGTVVYKDAFRKRHETSFSYVYTVQVRPSGQVVGEFTLGGPTNYNKTT